MHTPYKDVLEIIPETTQPTSDGRHPLFKSISDYVKRANLLAGTHVVSLSGGVDSMVLCTILKHQGVNLLAAHINYHNRLEASREQSYLEEWCKIMKIPLQVREITEMSRATSDRADYERQTSQIRFKFYRDCLDKTDPTGKILYGHHLDDVTENVVTNFMRGRDVHDLVVMHEETPKAGVVVSRPMLKHPKSDIYTYAHQNGVPYFKDTTPEWSNRYKIRNRLLPLLREMYGTTIDSRVVKNAQKAEIWAKVIKDKVLSQLEQVCTSNTGSVRLNNLRLTLASIPEATVWNEFLIQKLNHLGYSRISHKAFSLLWEKLVLGRDQRMQLSRNCLAEIVSDELILTLVK